LSIERLSLADTPRPERTRYRNQAARRVLSVLSAFSQASEPRGVSELARTLHMSKNMVHRALTTLMKEGFVVRDASGQRYQLGPRVLELSMAEEGEFDLVAVCRPSLEKLHALTGESVFLSIIVGMSRVTVDEIVPPGPRVLRSSRGAQVPLHCTKMSRMLLAHLADEDIDAYLAAAAPLHRAMPSPDPASETADAVWKDVRGLRRSDRLLWRNPHHSSAAYAIFPLLDEAGRPHAIVTWVTGRLGIARLLGPMLLPAMMPEIEALRRRLRLVPAPHPLIPGA